MTALNWTPPDLGMGFSRELGCWVSDWDFDASSGSIQFAPALHVQWEGGARGDPMFWMVGPSNAVQGLLTTPVSFTSFLHLISSLHGMLVLWSQGSTDPGLTDDDRFLFLETMRSLCRYCSPVFDLGCSELFETFVFSPRPIRPDSFPLSLREQTVNFAAVHVCF